jgi:hypothetical protein
MNLYNIGEMKIHGDSLMSFRITGPNGFSLWVHKELDEIKAVISASEMKYERYKSILGSLSSSLSQEAVDNIIDIIDSEEE